MIGSTRRNLSWQFPALRSLQPKSSSATRHYFRLSASTFATYLKGENPEYFAIRPVSRPQTEDRCLSDMTKRRPTAASGLDARLLTEDPEWRRAFRTGWLALVLLLLFCRTGSAESTQETEFLPEVDTYLKLKPDIRVSFLAKDTREGGDSTQAAIGPSVDFYLKPLIRLKRITAFDLDDAKSRPLVLTAGYNFLAAPNSPSTNRVIVSATSHLPIKADLLIDRQKPGRS